MSHGYPKEIEHNILCPKNNKTTTYCGQNPNFISRAPMSIIGPRPALWNQYDLIDERDKYGANDVPVGLTGWAQINGRDELPIEIKAKLDGDYLQKRSLWFDLICFIGTFTAVLRSKGVIEGGTGVIAKMTKDKEESR